MSKDKKQENRIFAEVTREDHTTCKYCRAPFYNPHGTVNKKPCPGIVQASW